jgi:hypothetical protein
MMVTLLGDIVSDALESGQVVSGVGGQYNFVAQGFALHGARSIIMLRSHRIENGKAQSNIRWNYGHTTIPRHLRDVVITEYGIADLRGKSDRDVIVAMLAVADSRFQDELLRQAQDAGKIEKNFEIAAPARNNFPATLESALEPARKAGIIPSFPFGTDFTAVEERLLPALQALKSASLSQRLIFLILGMISKGDDQASLKRLGLDRPEGAVDRVYAAMLRGALRQVCAKN